MAELRTLTIEDIGDALKLSKSEKWNQTEDDWKFLIETPENICLAAIEDHKIVGTATATVYDSKVAWIGMVLVNKNYRGKGISKLLLSCLFDKLEHCSSIKLDATPAGQPVYQKFNFKDEYKLLRMTNISGELTGLPYNSENGIRQVSVDDIPEIVSYDEHVFGANRQALIEYLFNNNQENSWILKQRGEIAGYALGRQGERFYQVGPVSASSFDNTRLLILKALHKNLNKPVVIDVFNDKTELVTWLTMLGFKIQRPFCRMYQNENPFPGFIEKQFIICGPEFG